MSNAAVTSFADPQVQQCPFPHYDQLRKETPVYF